MVFDCSLQTFRLHFLHCCLTFQSLLRGQTMQRFFCRGPSSARACFYGPIATEWASSVRTVVAFKPFGYCALFNIFGLINCSPSEQRNRNRAREVIFIPGTTGGRSLYKTNALYTDNVIEHSKQLSWYFAICCVEADFLIHRINTCFAIITYLVIMVHSWEQ